MKMHWEANSQCHFNWKWTQSQPISMPVSGEELSSRTLTRSSLRLSVGAKQSQDDLEFPKPM